jgi:hypothetical protein
MPRRIDVVGDVVLVWGTDAVAGIAAGPIRQLWTRPCKPIGDAVKVWGQPWIAFRTRGEGDWHLLDARSGELVFEASLGEHDELTAIVADNDRLLVAGPVGPLNERGEAPMARVIAIDATSGRRHWSRDFATRVAINATQLRSTPRSLQAIRILSRFCWRALRTRSAMRSTTRSSADQLRQQSSS